MIKLRLFQLPILLSLFIVISQSKVFAGIEPYENFIKGKINKNDSLTVKDEKFKNPLFNWTYITNTSVNNIITLSISDSAYVSKNFSCSVVLKINYYSDPNQTTPTVIDSVKLGVNYAKEPGKAYKGSDNYKFKNGYYVKIFITDINSAEYGAEIPPVLQLTNRIIIDRQYQFLPEFPVYPSIISYNNSNSLQLDWAHVLGAEEYDLEWATVDEGSEFEPLFLSLISGAAYFEKDIEKVFKNNATRITTHDNSYNLSLLPNSKYLFLRIRQVQYDTVGIRKEGYWSYKTSDGKYAVTTISWNEPGLNWQTSTTYAEEGKKKEVVNYFDGSLRNRQTVTINNSDNVAVVQENIYDKYGRQAASILPAPGKEAGIPHLHYFTQFNTDSANKSYSFRDLALGCEINPSSLNSLNGASKYYSANNYFLNVQHFNKYIPDAEGFPLSITQYTADNTGRIKLQGGVGLTFQPGKTPISKTTKYYYGKPEQWELDKLFGNDVGFADHYLKNMVIDPNGQISISYLNAGGKTIATALTGAAPSSQDPLPSSGTKRVENIHLLSPDRFVFAASDLKLSATTTYLASVTGPASFNYNIEKLVSTYPGTTFKPCSNCYYDLTVKVFDDCKNPIFVTSEPVKIGADTSNCNNTGLQVGSFDVSLPKIGEYYINFDFSMSRKVIETFTDNFITKGNENGYLNKEIKYILNHLRQTDFSGLFSNCKTCSEMLASKPEFKVKMLAKLQELEVKGGDLTAPDVSVWLDSLYTNLSDTCAAAKLACKASPCEEVEKLMLDDLSPGGQYALFDQDGKVLEEDINVLARHWREEFPISAPGTSNYESEIITQEDGTQTSPYAADFYPSKIVKYWKEEWAQKFLHYHPEFCKLEFCRNNAQYVAWDNEVTENINSASGIAAIPGSSGLQYRHDKPEWLLDADPFFKQGAPGAAYYNFIKADLQNYSKAVLKNDSEPTQIKGLIAMVDYVLYCVDKSQSLNSTASSRDVWTNCTPLTACRVPDREWEYYKDMYFEVKEVYFNKVRADFCNSGPCQIGSPYSLPKPQSYLVRDFNISKNNTSCATGMQSISISYTPGKVKKQVTLEIYYPGRLEPLKVLFTAGDSQQGLCIPGGLPLKGVKVTNIIQ